MIKPISDWIDSVLDKTSDFIILSSVTWQSSEGVHCRTGMFLWGWGLGDEGGFCYDAQKTTWRRKGPEREQETREVWWCWEGSFWGITLLLKFEEYTGFNVIMRWRNFLAEGIELQEMRNYESSNTYIIWSVTLVEWRPIYL